MRVRMLLLGLVSMLTGIVAESLYVIDSKIAYSGPTMTMNVSLWSGIVFILLGLILMISSERIPEIHISET